MPLASTSTGPSGVSRVAPGPSLPIGVVQAASASTAPNIVPKLNQRIAVLLRLTPIPKHHARCIEVMPLNRREKAIPIETRFQSSRLQVESIDGDEIVMWLFADRRARAAIR